MRIHDLGSSVKALDSKALPGGKGDDFADTLMDALKEVNQAQTDSRNLQNDFMANRPVELHDLMVSMERASTAMQLTLQVRNKLLEAYQEINRMQV